MSDLAERLEQLAKVVAQPESLGVNVVLHKNDNDQQTQQGFEASLHSICQTLFQTIEHVHRKHAHLLHKKRGSKSVKQHSLSQLNSLIISANESDANAAVDAETIFAQVDLQSVPLQKRIQKSAKQLQTASETAIRLLMMQEEEEASDGSSEDDGSDNEHDDLAAGVDGSDEEDDEAKRMRGRMERALADMELDAESGDELELSTVAKEFTDSRDGETTKADDIPLVDKAADELNDGFFDLNEMEAFADEEEEYLPDEAYGEEADEPLVKDKRSFHQRQRDGDIQSDDDEDSGDDALAFRKPTSIRRRKYREDDEVKALFSLYDRPKNDDLEDDEIINMTAADVFGQPDKKYRHGDRNKLWSDPKRKNTSSGVSGDDDSWDGHNFDDADMDAGWGFGDNADADDHEDDGDDDEEEEMPMKGSAAKIATRGGGKSSKLVLQTEELEAEMLAEKPWQMTGEAGSMERPVNSLLDLTPEFDVASKLKPIATVEQTADLEEVIKQRIVKEDWDDIVPRELPDVGWHSKRREAPEVSQEKSKLSLGELYEQEYLKKAVGYDVQATERQSLEDKAKDEMKSLFANLCSKLDALSNYHFAPRPIAEEAEVRTITTPAIAVEEVLPLYVSDARGAAPEEVYGAKRGRESVLRGDSEMEQGERKRLRASKKSARRQARKEKLADEKLVSRLQPGLGLNNPYEKRKVREELSAARAKGRVKDGQLDTNDYGASGTFFARLQDEAGQKIRGVVEPAQKKPKGNSTSSALKL